MLHHLLNGVEHGVGPICQYLGRQHGEGVVAFWRISWALSDDKNSSNIVCTVGGAFYISHYCFGLLQPLY